MNKSHEERVRQQNMNKLQARGKDTVKQQMVTSFISSGSFKGMSKEDIARAANVDYGDRKHMKHIETQLNRHDARERKK